MPLLDAQTNICLKLTKAFKDRYLQELTASAFYGIDTGGGLKRIRGAVLVKHETEVQHIILLAQELGLKLWPISGGRNFGYGTALPAQSGAFIVDLSALKSIEYNESAQSVTIGAGVTLQELRDYLIKKGLPYLVPTTGAGPHGSLIGNALDGGYGMTPISDHFEGLSNFKGFWGNGMPLTNSLESLGCSDMANRWPLGVGLSTHGLLRQSNLAIVTRATLQLYPKQPYSRVMVMQWKSEAAFEKGQEALAALKEVIPAMTAVLTVNKNRAQASSGNFRLQSAVPSISTFGQDPQYTSIATIFGPKHSVKGACADIKKALKNVTIITFTSRGLDYLAKVADLAPNALLARSDSLRHLHQKIVSLSHTKALLEGQPSAEFLRLAYCANQPTPSMHIDSNPAKDGQGILWFAPLIAPSAPEFSIGLQTIRHALALHGFDDLIGITLRSSRAAIVTVPLIFTKTPENIRKAKACYAELLHQCHRVGLPLYRVGSTSMSLLADLRLNEDHQTLHRQLKKVLDPYDVIAPGRYC